MDAQARLALSRSNLRALPGSALDELMAGASRVRIPPGSVTHWEGEPAPFLELVVSGVVRGFVAAPDGRTMTIRYCRSGSLIGAASLFAAAYAMPAPTQALVDVELLRMSPTAARRAAEHDVRVATALLGEVSERVVSFVWETLRQRIRHGPPARGPASARSWRPSASGTRHRSSGRDPSSWSRSASGSSPRLSGRLGRSSFESCVSCARRAWSGQDGTRS